VIDSLVVEQLRLMAEHVIDRRLLDGMSDILMAIRRPSWLLSVHESIPAHNLPEVIQ
jgi:hypothetical protein